METHTKIHKKRPLSPKQLANKGHMSWLKRILNLVNKFLKLNLDTNSKKHLKHIKTKGHKFMPKLEKLRAKMGASSMLQATLGLKDLWNKMKKISILHQQERIAAIRKHSQEFEHHFRMWEQSTK